MTKSDKYAQLIEEGFCKFEGVLDCSMIAELREVTDRAIGAQTVAHFQERRSHGSLIDVRAETIMVSLISQCLQLCDPAITDTLR